MGISQAISADIYCYRVDVESITGSIKVFTDADGTLATISSAGIKTACVNVTDTTIKLSSDGACEAVLNSFSMFNVKGGNMGMSLRNTGGYAHVGDIFEGDSNIK
jgi:hypothetical protein